MPGSSISWNVPSRPLVVLVAAEGRAALPQLTVGSGAMRVAATVTPATTTPVALRIVPGSVAFSGTDSEVAIADGEAWLAGVWSVIWNPVRQVDPKRDPGGGATAMSYERGEEEVPVSNISSTLPEASVTPSRVKSMAPLWSNDTSVWTRTTAPATGWREASVTLSR